MKRKILAFDCHKLGHSLQEIVFGGEKREVEVLYGDGKKIEEMTEITKVTAEMDKSAIHIEVKNDKFEDKADPPEVPAMLRIIPKTPQL